ncbi:Glutathione S-transferase T2 [Glycine soja]
MCTQLKSRWNKIHPPVQKFNECYKQADKHRRSGSSENDVLVYAHMIYSQDTSKKFEVEHAWLLLKDQPKFDVEFMSKTKVSAFRNYSSSSNPETPVEVEEYDMSSPMSRPIVSGLFTIFGNEYLRRPNNEDIERLLQMGAAREFSEWKNCPVAWKGQFCRGDHRNPTIILEAVASQDLWI